MIYQKALREINTVFPKLSIRPPTKKAVVRSLVQQVQCSTLTNNDFTLLKNKQTSMKPLHKLKKLVNAWISILENNQKARQQQQSKPVNRNFIDKMQYMLAKSNQIASKTDFIEFLTQVLPEHMQQSSSSMSQVWYKDTQIPKQPEFFNTITHISQEQYLKSLEGLLEKLGVLEQLVQHQIVNMDHLQELNNMVQNDELFKKKDNEFYRVIKYNFIKTVQTEQALAEAKALQYFYEENIVFSIARIYYLIYLSRKEIEQHQNNQDYLIQVQKFLCERPERVFPRLYNRKILKPLSKLQNIRHQVLHRHFDTEQPPSKIELTSIQSKIIQIQSNLSAVAAQSKSLEQLQFLQIYKQIQEMLTFIYQSMHHDQKNEKAKQLKQKLCQLQDQAIRLFAGQKNYDKDLIGLNDKNKRDRKYLSIQNSRLSSNNKVLGQQKFRKSQAINNFRNTMKSIKSNKSNIKIEPDVKINHMDSGQDVFIYPVVTSATNKSKEDIQVLSKNQAQYEKQCRKYLQAIKPQYGQMLEDTQNFTPDKLNFLLEVGSVSNQTLKQKELLSTLSKNLIKPEITEKNFDKIFNPQFRFPVLKTLHEKLIEMEYKNLKSLDAPEFVSLPENVKKFIEGRTIFLKAVNKQLDKIMGIATIISRLQFYKKYDVFRFQTLDTFLKILLAEKQAKAYQMSFKDQKKISKQTAAFINNKLYYPFIDSLSTMLPAPFNTTSNLVNVIDQLDFYMEFRHFTDQIIQNFMNDFDSEQNKQNIQNLKKQMTRILSKWVHDCESRLKDRKNQVFQYGQAQAQLNKLKQFIKLCQNDKTSITDPIALKLVKILQSKH